MPRCFYVGQGVKTRPSSKKGRNHKWRAVVKRFGLRIEVCVGPVTHKEACEWEIAQIEQEKTFSVNHSHDDSNDVGCNFTHGGEGSAGRICSDEERAKHSLNAKRMWADVEKREELIGKLRNAWKDPSILEKHRVAAKSAMSDPDVIEKHRASLARADVKEKHSASAKAYWTNNPDALAKRTASQRESWKRRKQAKEESS